MEERVLVTTDDYVMLQHPNDLTSSEFSTQVKKQYNCNECNYKSNNLTSINRHKSSVHGVENRFKCPLCDYSVYYKSDLKTHLLSHNVEKTFKCDICGYASNLPANLETHKRVHSEERLYKCDECELTFRTTGHLKRHKLSVHVGATRFTCSSCSYVTFHKSNFQSHLLVHTGEKPYKCDVCDYASTELSSLKSHKLRHSGEKPHKCGDCDLAFTRKQALRRHQLSAHGVGKRFTCSLCSYSAICESGLKSHFLVHTGEKNFQCDACDYTTNLPANLKTHKRIHSGEKPYKCSECESMFRTPGHLKRHKLSVHVGAKRFSCASCSYVTFHKSNLQSHLLVHTGEKPYKCDVCNFATSERAILKNHQLRHGGVKPHKCDKCESSYIRASHLKSHLLSVHGVGKQFSCSSCNFVTNKNSELKKHVCVHTEEKTSTCGISNYKSECSTYLMSSQVVKNEVEVKERLLTHSPLIPHKCIDCDYYTHSSTELQNHILSHIASEQFKCSVKKRYIELATRRIGLKLMAEDVK